MSVDRDPRPLVVGIVAAGALAALGASLLPHQAALSGGGALAFALGYACVFLGAQRAGFRLQWNEHSTRISLEEFTLVAGVILLPPSHLIAAAAASSVANQLLLRRPLVKAAFNVGQYSLATSAAAAGFLALLQLGAPPIWAAVPVTFVFSFVSQGATATLFSRLDGTNAWSVFRARFLVWAIVAALVGVSLGMAAFALWSIAPVATLAILPIFVLLNRLGRLTAWAEEEARLHRALAEAAVRVAQTGDFDEGAATILETSARALGAGEMRLHVALVPGASSTWSWHHHDGAGATGIRAPIPVREGEPGEIQAFPQGARPFGRRERHLLDLVAEATASAARTHGAMLALTETNRRLTSANHELEEFTLWTTHDMREPLRSVGQLAQILHEDLDQLSRAEVADLASRIHQATTRLKDRIKALHEFSRIVQHDVPYETTDIGLVVDAALDGLAARIAESEAQIERPASLPTTRAQKARLVNVFANLFENALKYSDKARPRITLSYVERPAEIEFSVQDDGPGIAPAARERVFHLFQRGGAGEGSGAGLAIVKRIVEQHGGRAWIEAAPGGGADVRFTLPKDPAGVAPAASASAAPAYKRVTPSLPTS